MLFYQVWISFPHSLLLATLISEWSWGTSMETLLSQNTTILLLPDRQNTMSCRWETITVMRVNLCPKVAHFRNRLFKNKIRMGLKIQYILKGDGLKAHNGMKFSTKDNDNSVSNSTSCPKHYEGAWWFKNCYRNGVRQCSTFVFRMQSYGRILINF